MSKRLVLPVLSLVILAAICVTFFHSPVYVPVNLAFSTPETLTGVTPELTRIGAHVGDRLAESVMPQADVIRAEFGTQKDGVIDLVVNTSSGVRSVAALATLPSFRKWAWAPLQWFELVCYTCALVIAGYLGYRRPTVMMAALILFLGGGVSWVEFSRFLIALPNWIFVDLLRPVIILASYFPTAALASFAIRFPDGGTSHQKQRAIRVVDTVVITMLLCEIVRLYRPGWTAIGSLPYEYTYIGFSVIVLVAASVLSLHFAAPGDRARTQVVFAAIMLGGVGYALSELLIPFLVGNPTLYYFYNDLAVLSVPAAVAYGIMRHRVIDIGFVLNRTAVYAITSAVILLLLAALEFISERFLNGFTHAQSIAFEFGIALAVILSARAIHSRADAFVDTVLFRKRHEDEQAIRSFAHEAAYITDEATLIGRTTALLERHADATFVRIAGYDGAHHYGDVSENDPAIVALRAWHKALDLHSVQSQLQGEFAYPMVTRGKLIGALILGPKRSAESYAPDESEAIAYVAHSVAGVLDVLSAKRETASNPVLERIESLLVTQTELLRAALGRTSA